MKFLRYALVAAAILLSAPALAFWHGVASAPSGYVPTYYFLGF